MGRVLHRRPPGRSLRAPGLARDRLRATRLLRGPGPGPGLSGPIRDRPRPGSSRLAPDQRRLSPGIPDRESDGRAGPGAPAAGWMARPAGRRSLDALYRERQSARALVRGASSLSDRLGFVPFDPVAAVGRVLFLPDRHRLLEP